MIHYKSPKKVAEEIKKFVIGQDIAVDSISLFLFQYLLYHYSAYVDQKLDSSPIALLLGESGCGKTHLIRTLAKIMNFDLLEINAKSIVQEGWEGTSLKKLIISEFKMRPAATDNSIYKIIFIDEIDKICQPLGSSASDNINPHIQNSILKYLEGFKIIDDNPKLQERINIDLTKCCFILAGNFQSIRDSRTANKQAIGFTHKIKEQDDRITKELEDFGMIPEFVGRISQFIELNSLTKPDYLNVIESENLYFKKYTRLLNHLNINISLTDSEINAILDKTIELKIGVRGLLQEINKVIVNQIQANEQKLESVIDYFNYLTEAERSHDEWVDKVRGLKL